MSKPTPKPKSVQGDSQLPAEKDPAHDMKITADWFIKNVYQKPAVLRKLNMRDLLQFQERLIEVSFDDIPFSFQCLAAIEAELKKRV